MSTFVDSFAGTVKDSPYALPGVAAAGLGVGWWVLSRSKQKIDLPYYGSGLPFLWHWDSLKLMREGRKGYTDIYAQHPMYLMPGRGKWIVVVDNTYIDEINKAPDEILSFEEAIEDLIHSTYTMGPNLSTDFWHIKTIQNQLTRKLNNIFPEVYDEIQYWCEKDLNPSVTDWERLNVMKMVSTVVASASNRAFVGLPLCRNEEWLSLMQNGALSIMTVVFILHTIPKFLHPIIGPLVSTHKTRLNKAAELLGSIIDERLAMDPEDRPDDMVTWLLATAPDAEKNTKGIADRLLGVNFAAIHTSTMNLTHALYWLLARPEYIEPMRQEIEEITGEMGWTKDAISHMHRLDNFMKECQRINPLGALTMSRKVLKDFTFSNGVRLPAGTLVSTHQWAVHQDPKYYSNPAVFDPDRFVEMVAPKNSADADANGMDADDAERVKKSTGGQREVRKTMYTTSKTYLPFGHGRHACPGRFFASMELKSVMAYLVANYEFKWPDDVKLDEKGRYRPEDQWIGEACSPNRHAEILIRKRNKV